eukprot:2027425-Rhodomonas_salina.1
MTAMFFSILDRQHSFSVIAPALRLNPMISNVALAPGSTAHATSVPDTPSFKMSALSKARN